MTLPPIDALRTVITDHPVDPQGEYVLYWMTAARRTRWSHALQHAVGWSQRLNKPLLVVETLALESPWACTRTHRFIIEGMHDNQAHLERAGATYISCVAQERGDVRRLITQISESASIIIADLDPMHRGDIKALDVSFGSRRVELVDSVGVVALALPNRDFTVAHSFRRWAQKTLPTSWDPPVADPLGMLSCKRLEPSPSLQRTIQHATDHRAPLPSSLRATPGEIKDRGGYRSGIAQWKAFRESRLARYDQDRSHPDDDVASGLSPWLNFGQVGTHEIMHDLLGEYDLRLAPRAHGRRQDWWPVTPAAEAFIDQIVTWRELGTVQAHRDLGKFTSYGGLPAWALKTLDEHRDDARSAEYTLQQLEQAQTSDPLWNAAQRQLVREGRIHNALRMLWGKLVLNWTETPEQAFEYLVTLNNRYAIDGCDAASWSGIGWVFGRFDRAWGPERLVYGKVRYMTSASSRRKWRLKAYLARHGE
jgi:deoxyribodipyrimidine photo-lyase